MTEIVWTQWDDLTGPEGFEMLNPKNAPLDSARIKDVTFYVPTYMGGRNALLPIQEMPNLKYIQLPNAGFDDALEFLKPNVTLCNAKGVHDMSTAELALGLTISSLRGFPHFYKMQSAGQWDHRRMHSLSGKKVGLVGYGSIGKKFAQMIEPFEVELTAFNRSGSDGAQPISQLDDYLPTLDVVVLILPANPESVKLFDSRRLGLMKDGALLVNVARGVIVDTDALIGELTKKRIFAALDVTDPEPLPKDHPLWGMENLTIVPHVGGNSTAFEPRIRKLVKSQLDLLAAGKEIENIVAKG
ncbi:MAG: 2-hydroxyacid dehydrogenase [Candidatus Nanopelagicales bacterium]|jgi:phosphoglycerate dehydrogenase-like enzyme